MHKLIRKEYINSNLFKLYFEKKDLKFKPGQHFSLSIPGKSLNREYSTYTSMDDKELGFLIRKVEGGRMTNLLNKMSVGDALNIYGPYGTFTIEDNNYQNRKIIFIASGTGIAPFVSIKKSYNILNYKLFLGVRNREDIIDESIFDIDKSYYCISRDKIILQNNHYVGRMNKQISKIDYIDDYQNYIYMICGNSFMISDIYDLLVNEKNISPNNIITESFF